jgi:thiamine biosynthesis lipoprotein
MACRFQVYLNAGQHPDAARTAMTALDEVDRVESILTVYRADSEVSVINKMAGDEPVSVGPNVWELLSLAVQLHAETGGAFDVTAGPLSETWGFARRAGRVPSDSELAAVRAKVGSGYLDIDQQQQSVRFTRPGVKLNFGGIGKGYALDVSSRLLEADGIRDFLFHGGRSSVLARGARLGSDDACRDGGWQVGLIHPQRPQVRLAEVRLRDRALSTSGSQMQSFQHRGCRYGHILDPRTGRPCEGMLSVTVLAATAALADALSTALFVMGPDDAAKFCQQHPDIAAILIFPAAGTSRMEVQAFNLNDADWKTLDD